MVNGEHPHLHASIRIHSRNLLASAETKTKAILEMAASSHSGGGLKGKETEP
jgi:hypothetical protein